MVVVCGSPKKRIVFAAVTTKHATFQTRCFSQQIETMVENGSVHRIRLAGPWQVVIGDESRQIELPACWQEILGDYGGPAIFRRSFNSPTGLKNQRLFIVLPATGGFGTVWLNHVLVGNFNDTDVESLSGVSPERRFEITQPLQRFNQLKIELTCHPQSDLPYGLCEPVILEIVE